MIRRQTGFTLVELMVTMVIFLLVIAAMASIFAGLLGQFKQQSKIAETNIEGIVGLEILRFNLEQAGYGLPWTVDLDGTRRGNGDWSALGRYCEAAPAAAAPNISPNPAAYNDGAASAACTSTNFGVRAPRAVVAGNGVGPNGSDYLVIKALNLGLSAVVNRWTYIRNSEIGNAYTTAWGSGDEDPADENSVIVIKPSAGNSQRILLTDSDGFFFTEFNTSVASFNSTLAPYEGSFDTFVIYGIADKTNLRMPFNRADFYIMTESVPARCARGTGVLMKRLLNQGSGLRGDPLPLIDCVADLQITLRLDINDDGIADTTANADGSTVFGSAVGTTLTDAELIRQRLKEVHMYILAHEGQRDPSFTFSNFTGGGTSVLVGNNEIGDAAALTANFDFASRSIADYLNYRWRVFQLIITPHNVRL